MPHAFTQLTINCVPCRYFLKVSYLVLMQFQWLYYFIQLGNKNEINLAESYLAEVILDSNLLVLVLETLP